MIHSHPIPPFDDLARRIAGEVHTDLLRRVMLATDGSIFQRRPRAVVYPKSTADVVSVVRFAAENDLTVHCRGSGSGLAGSAIGPGIVLDFSRHMNRLVHLDADGKWFECEPGYRLGQLEVALSEIPLFFPPDPSSGEYASFGGMVGTNASGAHSVKYGNVADYVLDAEVVFADGRVAWLSAIEESPADRLPSHLKALGELYTTHRGAIDTGYPAIQCNVAGYNLRGLVREGRLRLHRLITGAEGTLAIVTRLRFRLLDRPAHDSLVVAYFDDIVAAARAVGHVLPLKPAGIEIMDKSLLRLARESDARLRGRIPDGVDNVLLIAFDGDTAEETGNLARQAMDRLVGENLTHRIYPAVTAAEKTRFWAVRKAAVPILYKLKGERKILALIEDAAVPTDRLTEYFAGIYDILNRNAVPFVVYGHIAKGLMHTRPLLNLKDPGDIAKLRVLADAVFELVDGLGGTVSGEHGDGRLRSAYIRRKYPEIYPLMRRAKALLDPRGMLNPEIKTHHDPGQMQTHLRYGGRYRAADPGRPQLQWPEGFSGQVELCHGCSKCTTVTPATRMCPVFKVTRDEIAAPKAKANLLRALISGAVADRCLFEESFQTVMAQCVNCGSCRVECPSNVDIPKLALEARGRYVARYGPSRADWLTGHVEIIARATHGVSALMAPLAASPFLRAAGEGIAGISARRDPVAFARRSLFQRLGTEAAGSGSGPRVLYFVGCDATYIRPEIGEAAHRVLTHLGFRVMIPAQHCCGLPLLSKGMIAAARKKVSQNLRQWRRQLHEADYVVVTCSSCGLSLQKEWADLADDPDIRMLRRKLIHISRLVLDHENRLQPVRPGPALAYHRPCHLNVQPDPESSLELLSRISGGRVTALGNHCCGMAGSWGLLADHFDLSRTIGAPMLEALNRSGAALAATDCPTCRMQIAQFSTVPVRHPVEIVAGCIDRPLSGTGVDM